MMKMLQDIIQVAISKGVDPTASDKLSCAECAELHITSTVGFIPEIMVNHHLPRSMHTIMLDASEQIIVLAIDLSREKTATILPIIRLRKYRCRTSVVSHLFTVLNSRRSDVDIAFWEASSDNFPKLTQRERHTGDEKKVMYLCSLSGGDV